MKYSFSRFLLAPLTALIMAGLAVPVEAAGERGGGGGNRGGGGGAQAGGGGGARAGGGAQAGGAGGARNTQQVNNSQKDVRTNNARSTSVNNVNANKNVNVNVEGNNSGCCGWDNDYHPVAAAAVVGTTMAVTSAVIGSMVRTPPPGCVPVNYGGIVYQQCGTTWYQPQAGQYVVINPPY
jgi:hypothetical protein